MLCEPNRSVRAFTATAEGPLHRLGQNRKTLNEMIRFVQGFAKKLNEWLRFVLFSPKRLTEMRQKLDEMRISGGLFVHFVQLFNKAVEEMPHFVCRFYRMLDGMHYFLDEMRYFVHYPAHFAELFSDRMHPFCHSLVPLDERQALDPQRVWHFARFRWEIPGNPGLRSFWRPLFGMGPAPAVRMPGHRLRRPGLRALFLQP